jgi:hypothetical protein
VKHSQSEVSTHQPQLNILPQRQPTFRVVIPSVDHLSRRCPDEQQCLK